MAEKSAGEISISISADITQIKRDLDATKSLLQSQVATMKTQTKQSESVIKGMQNQFATMAKYASVATGVAVAGFSAMIKQGLANADALAKQSASLGVTAKDLTILQHAADLSGISQEQLTASIKKLTIGLGQAESGSGTAAKALEKLGLSTAELSKMSASEKVSLLITKIKDVVPASQQAAVAADLFGSKTALAMMNLSGDTIAHAAEQVDKFRVVLTDIEYKQIEQANDAITDMKLAYTSVTQQLAAAFAPTLQMVAELIGDTASNSLDLKSSFQDLALTGVKAAALLTQSFLRLKQAFVIVDTGIDVIQEKFYELKISAAEGEFKAADNMLGIWDAGQVIEYKQQKLAEIDDYKKKLTSKTAEIEKAADAFQKANKLILDIQDGSFEKTYFAAVEKSQEAAVKSTKAEKAKKAATQDTTEALKEQSKEYEKSYAKITEATYKLTHSEGENKEFDLAKDVEAYKAAGVQKADIDKYTAATRAQWEAAASEKVKLELNNQRDAYLEFYKSIGNDVKAGEIELAKIKDEIDKQPLSDAEKQQLFAQKEIELTREKALKKLQIEKDYYDAVGETAKSSIAQLAMSKIQYQQNGMSEGEAGEAVYGESAKKQNYSGLASGLGVDGGLAAQLQSNLDVLDNFHQQELDRIEQQYATIQDEATKNALMMADLKQLEFTYAVGVASAGFGTMAQLAKDYYNASGQQSKTALRAYQVLAVAQAMMNAYLSASKAYTEGGPYLGPVLAAIALASGLAQVVQIKQQKFHSGGVVKGEGEVPTTLLAGEGVLSHRGLANLDKLNLGSPTAASAPDVNITVANYQDKDEFLQALQSRRGQEIIKNVVGA
jgi:hypothetical protein